MAKKIQRVIHVNSKAKTKNVSNKNFHGADHIVIEGVGSMIAGTVMNDILYNKEAINEMIGQIKGNIHAPLAHPQDDAGNFILAGSPEAIAKNYCGAFAYNYRMKNDRLVHDLAINPEVARNSEDGRELLRRIEEKEDIDTSTGIIIYEFNEDGGVGMCGTPYSREAMNMLLDHDAILIRERGAATSNQGVGIFANSQGEESKVFEFNTNASMIADQLPLSEIEFDEEGALERIKEFTDSKEVPSSNYRRFFLEFDRENTEDFNSYKYLFADIVDGKPVAVKKALQKHKKEIESNDSGKTEALEAIEFLLTKDEKVGNFMKNTWQALKKFFKVNEASFSDIREQIYSLLNKNVDPDDQELFRYPVEVYDTYFIYQKYDGTLYKKEYQVVDLKVVMDDNEGEQVSKNTVYEPIAPKPVEQTNEDSKMKELILAALAAASIATEGLTDEQLLAEYQKLQSGQKEEKTSEDIITIDMVKKMIDEALAASKNANEDAEKAELEKEAVENGIEEEAAKAMSTNSLRKILGKTGEVIFNASSKPVIQSIARSSIPD